MNNIDYEIRVLHVLDNISCGGTEAYIMNNYRELHKYGVRFDFVVLNNKYSAHVEEIKLLGGNIIFCPFVNKVKFTRDLINIIKTNGPYNAVHSHLNIRNSCVMCAAKKAMITRRISHIHAVYKSNNNFIKKLYYRIHIFILKRFSTKILACSSVAGASLCGNKWFKKNGIVANNGIDVKKYINNETLNKASEKKQFKTIVNITRFDENKNQKFILDVFREINKIRNDYKLILGGPDGGTFKEIQKLVEKYGLSNSVSLIGPQDHVEQYLKESDIFIFPSKSEGLGIALLEAQASGCMCVTSNTVPKMADLDLGIVYFLDLDLGAKYWASFILDKFNLYNKPSNSETIDAFNKYGFSICTSAARLREFYEE